MVKGGDAVPCGLEGKCNNLWLHLKKIYQLRDPQTLEDAIRYGYLWYEESAESRSGFQLLLCQLQRFIVGFTKRDQERM